MADFVKLNDDKEGKGKSGKRKNWFSFKMLFIVVVVFFVLSSIISSISFNLAPKIAVVPINGVILTEDGSSLWGGTVSSSRIIAEDLYTIRDDDSVLGVVLDINSPGGSPVAAEEITKAIAEVSEVKPVYALVGEVGASGAFWVMVSADKVYASSMSTLGSIGVTTAGLSFEDFIENYNITYRRLTAGEFKDIGTPYREMTNDEEDIIQDLLDEIHVRFIDFIAENRNMSYEEVEEYATGTIFLGTTAMEAGFVDELGYYPDVIQDMKNEVGNNNTLIVEYGPIPTLAQELGFGALGNGFGSIFPDNEGKVVFR